MKWKKNLEGKGQNRPRKSNDALAPLQVALTNQKSFLNTETTPQKSIKLFHSLILGVGVSLIVSGL